MAVTRDQVAKLYVANFNRAPDAAGLDYWISDGTSATTTLTDLNAIAASMQAGAEASTGVASMTDSAYVVSLYSSMFGRTVAADSADVTYWTAQITAGSVTRANMIQTLILGAEASTGSATDAAVLANKTTVGLDYADAGLNGTFSVATVTADVATVTAAQTTIATTAETLHVAAYDAALVTYNAAVATHTAALVTAAAAVTAATTAAAAVSTVALATASQTAATASVDAATAVSTAAAAMVTAAAALTTTSAATPSVLDDAVATANVAAAALAAANATVAAAAADVVSTTAATALATAQAAYDAAHSAGSTFALTIAATDLIFGTERSDTITAANGTFQSGDIIADSSTIDNDTFTITTTSKTASGSTATVVGIENVIFNVSSSDLGAVNIALGAISDSNITINQLQAGAAATAGVTAVTNGSTITFGTGITSTTTVTQAVDSSITVNAGSSTGVTVSTVGAGSATGTTTVNGGSTMTTASVTMATTGTANIVGTTGLVTATTVAKTASITTTADTAATAGGINIDGTSTADTATISIGSAATITNGAANTVETLNISTSATQTSLGVVQTSVATIATAAATTYNLTGNKSITLAGNETMFDGKTLTDSTTAGTTTVEITTSGNSDLSKIAADVIALDTAGAHTYTVRNGQNIKIVDVAPSADVTFDINDQTSSHVNGSVTVDLGVTMLTGKAIAVTATSTSSDNISTLYVTNNTVAQGALDILATADTDVVLSGSKAVTLETTATAKTLNATNLTAALTMTAEAATIATVTGGSGNDVITATTAQTLVIDTGAGTADKIIAGTGASNTTIMTLSNFEILGINGTTDMKASQLSGKSVAIVDAGTNRIEFDTAAKSIDSSTIDFSGLIFNAASVIEIDGSAVSASYGLATALTITGSSVVDEISLATNTGANTISAGAGVDVIIGGTGIDTITGGEDGDTITGGLGADIIILTETTAATDTVVIGGGLTADSITGFTLGATSGDQLDFGIGALETAGAVVATITLNYVSLADAVDVAAAGNGDGPVGIQEITDQAAGSAVAAAGTNTVFALLTETYASTGAVETGLETGDHEITVHSSVAQFDSFLVAYSDGTDTHIANVYVANDTADFVAGDLVVTDLAIIKGTGTLEAGELNAANFDWIA